MATDFKKASKNGYGHYLRKTIPETQRKIEGYERTKRELLRRLDSIDWLIHFETKHLERDKQDLQTIETEYKQYEPSWEDWI